MSIGTPARSNDARIPSDSTAAAPRRELNLLDFTLLVVGAAIGADIYIVASLGAADLGPAQLVAWLVAGLLAALIALSFVQCAAIAPEVGGSYAYTRHAFGPLAGFLAGWALYLGELVALPIFPLAFLSYLRYFAPSLDSWQSEMVKIALVGLVTAVNLAGVRSSGHLNDLLTVVKLLPLGLLILAGAAFALLHPAAADAHLHPFAPRGWTRFGAAVVPIFWAYAGFELAVLPAGEVRGPRRTLPRGLLLGMGIVTVFYLLTSLSVVVALPWRAAAGAQRPLADALSAMLGALGIGGIDGGALMSLGALVSILGVFEVFTLSVARLSYAMAVDRLLPPALGRLHARTGTPYVGLLFQAASALLIAPLFNLASLIDTAVFFLGICYVFTTLSALRLIRLTPESRLHLPLLRPLLLLGAFSGALLAAQAPPGRILLGVGMMLLGLLLYAMRAGVWRRAELHAIDRQVARWCVRGEHWLLRSLRRYSAPDGCRDRGRGER